MEPLLFLINPWFRLLKVMVQALIFGMLHKKYLMLLLKKPMVVKEKLFGKKFMLAKMPLINLANGSQMIPLAHLKNI